MDDFERQGAALVKLGEAMQNPVTTLVTLCDLAFDAGLRLSVKIIDTPPEANDAE